MHVQYYTFPSSLKSLPAVRFVMVGLSELRNLTRLLSADLQTRNPYHQSRSLLEVIRQSLNMSRQNVLQEAKKLVILKNAPQESRALIPT